MPSVGRGVIAYTVIGGVLLAAVAAWCVWVVVSTGALRASIEQNVSILMTLTSLRATADDPTADLAARLDEARALSARVARLAPEAGEPAAVLLARLELLARGPDPAARRELGAAVEEITRAVRARNRALSIELGRRWTYLNGVAAIVVLLAASQSALLVLAHRRRVRVETSEAALRSRDQALRDAARRWATGDLATPVASAGVSRDDFETALDQLREALVRLVADVERRTHEVADLAADLRVQLVRKTEQLAALAPPLPARTEEDRPPVVVAERYEVLRTLGVGGMGTVHRVRRLADDRPLALKLMRYPQDERQRARFLREARLLAEIHHPNVVRILDVDIADNQPFFVTELIDGKNLAEETGWTVASALPVLRGIAAGLAAIHERGIVHRDLKLSNVMVGSGRGGDRLVKIVDFGIALDRALPPELGRAAVPAGEPGLGEVDVATPQTAALTQDGVMLGTFRYMPPEAGRDAPLTSAADVFAFGVVATRMLLGRFPWAEAPISLYRRLGELPAPVLDAAALPASLASLMRRCLVADPELRPTAAELVEALAPSAPSG